MKRYYFVACSFYYGNELQCNIDTIIYCEGFPNRKEIEDIVVDKVCERGGMVRVLSHNVSVNFYREMSNEENMAWNEKR